MTTVLIVDNDTALIEVLREILSAFTVVMATSGQGALHQLKAENPDLILLDLGLPDVDGMIVLGQLRRMTRIPIIVLSARDEQVARVVCLNCGADDFISKPFDIDEIEARVEAVLRRCQPVKFLPQASVLVATVGPLSISDGYGVVLEGRPFRITPTEYKLLHTLMQRPGEAVTRDYLATLVWGLSDKATWHTIDTHMGRVRRRLAVFPTAPTILTVPNFGYMIQKAKAS